MEDNLLGSLSEETNREMKKADKPVKLRESEEDSVRRDFLAEDFHDCTPNIYEAIIVMSQRARQLGQRQARIIEQFMASKVRPDDEDEEEEIVRPLDEDDDSPKLPKFEKPTVIAMNEMFKNNIKYEKEE
jgi:DNA-directed RNA polymerase subunit K/omega